LGWNSKRLTDSRLLINLTPNASSIDCNTTFDTEVRALCDSSRQGLHIITRTITPTVVLAPSSNISTTYQAVLDAATKEDTAKYLPADSDPTVVAG
jgi:hypothetical protein